jgi:hypothetical protein
MGWFKYQYSPYLYNFTLESWLYAPDGYADSSGGWFYYLPVKRHPPGPRPNLVDREIRVIS